MPLQGGICEDIRIVPMLLDVATLRRDESRVPRFMGTRRVTKCAPIGVMKRAAHFDSIPKVDKGRPFGPPRDVPSEALLKNSSTAIILFVRNWRLPRCESGDSPTDER